MCKCSEAVLKLFVAYSCFEASCMFYNGPYDHMHQPINFGEKTLILCPCQFDRFLQSL